MTKQRPDWYDEARALTGELRAIAEALSVSELRREDVADAARLAGRIRAALEGAPRRRWYDAEEPNPAGSEDSRRAYLEQSPIRGQLNPIAPPLVLEPATRPDGSPSLVGRLVLGRRYEGPPHGVHGGWVAALFDEVLGAAQGLVGNSGMTAILQVRYREVTPIEEELRFESWVEEQRGRRLTARATCHAGDTLTADAEGVFLRVDFGKVQEQMASRRRP